MSKNLLKNMVFFVLGISSMASNAIAFTYETYNYFSEGVASTVHVLVVDPKEHAIRPVKAKGKLLARETVPSLASLHGAVAAINGGFSKLDGTPAGILKIDHCWYGTPKKPRGAIGWSQDGTKVLIDQVVTNYDLDECPEGSEIEVYSASVPPRTQSEEWNEMEYIVGGTPVLITGGNLIEDYSLENVLESFLVNKHPRTAVGIRDNGDWVFVVVGGYSSKIADGMTMKELADFMLHLGCVEALNLCGGNSSTMVVEGMVSKEDEKQLRTVSDAILIFPTLH